jgi:pimeloyl-ACP methyl ester carboxylesterase
MTYRPRRPPRHQTLVLRGLRHHLTRWGPESDSPLVFLHGWMDTADSFQFVVDRLGDEWPCVGLDWRGFGRSDWEPGGYWFPNYLADLDALLDTVSPTRPARLIGHSMGGNVASLYAGVRPDRVGRLINIEGFGLPRMSPDQAPERYREWLEQLRGAPEFGTYATFDELANTLLRRNPRLDRDRAEFIARSWGVETSLGPVRVRGDPRHKLVNPVLYRREEAEACWRRITAPVLFVLGGQSQLRSRLGADGTDAHFSAVFRHLRIETISGAGHMLHHEQPEEVACLIESFLEEPSPQIGPAPQPT